jgi:hypothetical protein
VTAKKTKTSKTTKTKSSAKTKTTTPLATTNTEDHAELLKHWVLCYKAKVFVHKTTFETLDANVSPSRTISPDNRSSPRAPTA